MITETKPQTVHAYPKQNARMIEKRAAHPLNDKLVRLVEGARGVSMHKGGADVVGSGLAGYVWAVQGGKAIVDFGTPPGGGGPVRVVATEADLVLA